MVERFSSPIIYLVKDTHNISAVKNIPKLSAGWRNSFEYVFSNPTEYFNSYEIDGSLR